MLITSGRAAQLLSTTVRSLRAYGDWNGKLTVLFTPGNHARYRLEEVLALCGERLPPELEEGYKKREHQ